MALETADAAVLSNRVSNVAVLICLFWATPAGILQNLCFALGLEALFLATSVTATTGLWPAVLADTSATVLVTLNALRLLRYQSDT